MLPFSFDDVLRQASQKVIDGITRSRRRNAEGAQANLALFDQAG